MGKRFEEMAWDSPGINNRTNEGCSALDSRSGIGKRQDDLEGNGSMCPHRLSCEHTTPEMGTQCSSSPVGATPGVTSHSVHSLALRYHRNPLQL